MALAVPGATVEAASMVPYLAAIGLLARSPLSWLQIVIVLSAYCLVLVLPALALLAGCSGTDRACCASRPGW